MAALVHFHAVLDPEAWQFIVTVTLEERRFQSRMPPEHFEKFAANFRGVAEVGGYLINFEEGAKGPCRGSADLVAALSRQITQQPNMVEQMREYLMKVWNAHRNWCLYKRISPYTKRPL